MEDHIDDRPRTPTCPEEPTRIGRYRILAVLGEGGMGVVYVGEQSEPIKRKVALKIIKLGMDSKEVLRRFELERQSLAVMSHPCIASVFDAGTTDAGQPYFVMELVEGQPLTRYCDEHRLTLKERINVFQQVCQGVQHAHQKGVLHRDLKPANILVARKGDQHSVKIIDFGLAQATDQHLTENSMFTEHGQIIGTPAYMSPEQASGVAGAVDIRTDIYSLGVILYELLCGELPFSNTELRRAGLFEIQRMIREVEPAKPSTKLSTVKDMAEEWAQQRLLTAKALQKSLRGDLDWIVMMAIAKEPERRYETAHAFDVDLRRYLEYEPVAAGPPSVGYRLEKFARKYRTQVAAGVLVLCALIAGLVASLNFWNEAQTNLGRYDQLSNVVLLRKAREALPTTFPAWPENLHAIQSWLRDHGEPITAQLGRLWQSLMEVETRAVTRADEYGGKWTFASVSDEFLHETLAKLIADVSEFDSDVVAGVREREQWAARIAEMTLGHPHAAATWGRSARCDSSSERGDREWAVCERAAVRSRARRSDSCRSG